MSTNNKNSLRLSGDKLVLRGRKFFCVFKIGSSIQLELDM